MKRERLKWFVDEFWLISINFIESEFIREESLGVSFLLCFSKNLARYSSSTGSNFIERRLRFDEFAKVYPQVSWSLWNSSRLLTSNGFSSLSKYYWYSLEFTSSVLNNPIENVSSYNSLSEIPSGSPLWSSLKALLPIPKSIWPSSKYPTPLALLPVKNERI